MRSLDSLVVASIQRSERRKGGRSSRTELIIYEWYKLLQFTIPLDLFFVCRSLAVLSAHTRRLQILEPGQAPPVLGAIATEKLPTEAAVVAPNKY